MLVRNNVSRYHLARRAIKHAATVNPAVSAKANLLLAQLESKILEHRAFILEQGKDPDDLREWEWS
jgi:xylulose-5-phosphate/fructose-6-phosphate phosphoketolase